MPNWELEKCCFYLDLRLGCFILGYLNLFICTAGIILTIIVLATWQQLALFSQTLPQPLGPVDTAISAFTLISLTALLCFNIVLIVGLHKNKPSHVMAYLDYSMIFVLITFILFLVNAVTNAAVEDMICRAAGLLLSFYFIITIRSYYCQMQKESKRRNRQNNTAP